MTPGRRFAGCMTNGCQAPGQGSVSLLLREGLESGSLPSFFSGSYGAESPTRRCSSCGARPHILLKQGGKECDDSSR